MLLSLTLKWWFFVFQFFFDRMSTFSTCALIERLPKTLWPYILHTCVAFFYFFEKKDIFFFSGSFSLSQFIVRVRFNQLLSLFYPWKSGGPIKIASYINFIFIFIEVNSMTLLDVVWYGEENFIGFVDNFLFSSNIYSRYCCCSFCSANKIEREEE